VLLDKHKRILAALAGRPSGDQTWDGVVNDAADAMQEARARLRFSPDDLDHRRGLHASLAAGASHGGGTTVSLCTQ
jgi:hypothetical protein